jgi:hypothetical protein
MTKISWVVAPMVVSMTALAAADPADPEDGGDRRAGRRGQQLAPGERAECQRNEMVQGDGDEPPANDEHGAGDVGGPAGDDQVNDQQKAAGAADEQRSTKPSEA